jgi:hypothetical protein
VNTEPLIHTTLGNVPVASLVYETEWRMTDSVIHFCERYRDSTGAVVRQDAHVYAFGAEALSDANQPLEP